jgi:hypothetical protein
VHSERHLQLEPGNKVLLLAEAHGTKKEGRRVRSERRLLQEELGTHVTALRLQRGAKAQTMIAVMRRQGAIAIAHARRGTGLQSHKCTGKRAGAQQQTKEMALTKNRQPQPLYIWWWAKHRSTAYPRLTPSATEEAERPALGEALAGSCAQLRIREKKSKRVGHIY